MATLSILESKARDILSSVNATDNSYNEMRVRNVFWAMWSSSLPLSRIEAIAEAIDNEPVIGNNGFDAALKGLVRDKILRTRIQNGVKLYEINL